MGKLAKRLRKQKRYQAASRSETELETVTENQKEILRKALDNPFGIAISDVFRNAKIMLDMIQAGKMPLGLTYAQARQFAATMCLGILTVRDRYVEEKLGYNPISNQAATEAQRKIVPSSTFVLESELATEETVQ